MINRNNQHYDNQQVKGWRRLLAWLCAFMLLISSGGATAFADEDRIYSAPVTAPGNWIQETPAPEEPEEDEEEDLDAEEEEDADEEDLDEDEGSEEEATPEPTPDRVYYPGTLTAEAEDCSIRIDYTADARIPEDAALHAEIVQGADLYTVLKTAARLVRNEEDDGVWMRQVSGEQNRIYALTVTDEEGNEVRPYTGVTLIYENPENPEDVVYCLAGDDARILEPEEGSLTVEDYRLEPFGYAAVEKVQIGTVTLEYSENDYTVTAAYGPEAGFPSDTELKVREILPGTEEYTLYSGMTEDKLNEEWSEITLERYFDITFVSGGKELEPQADVDVQITFREAIELTEEHDMQAVHIENNEASVIESETDSNEAAMHNDEAIDTVSFTSDSFSVYGIVKRKKISQKVLAADGQTYEIEVTYGPEAEIPEGAVLKVEEIPEGSDLWEAYRKQTAAALDADDVRMPGLYDITILDAEGNEVEPKAAINVSITLANAENDENLHVVHFTEEIPEELVTSAAEEKTEEEAGVQPLAQEDRINSETIESNMEGQTVTFETESFSVYAFAYAVVYYYKTASGETYLIRLDYDADSGIPVGSVLNVAEILPEDPRYTEYLESAIQAAKKTGTEENTEAEEDTEPEENAETAAEQENEENNELTIPEDQYARFFDIEILYNGEKIEPTGIISVTIQLADAPEDRLEELKVIHFADAGTQVLDAEITAEAIQFDTESFSVYAVVTIPQLHKPTGVNDLDGCSILIKHHNSESYVTSEWYDKNDAPRQLRETNNADQASIWVFESAGQDGKYYISTTGRTGAQAGEKVYLHMERRDNISAHVRVYKEGSDNEWARPKMVFDVTQDPDGNYYISHAENGTTYYLNEWDGSGGYGYAAYAQGQNNPESTLKLVFTDTVSIGEGPYVLASSIEGARESYEETWRSTDHSMSTSSTEHYTKVVNGNAVMADVVKYGGNAGGQDSLASIGVHVWTEENGSRFVGGIASEWTIVWNPSQNAYNIKDSQNRYVCRDGTGYYNSGLRLATDQDSAAPFEFVPADQERVLIRVKGTDMYIHNSGQGEAGGDYHEWGSRYYTVWHSEPDSATDDFKFWLCKKSSAYDTLAAGKISAASLAPNQKFIIYRRFTHEDGSEELFAIATDGSMVRVYDGGDTIYWRETEKEIYWNYQFGEGHHLFKDGDTTTCISPLASSDSQTIAGYTSLTMIGKDGNEYGTTIECWDQAAYDYAGLHVTEKYNEKHEVIGAELSAGTRKEGTSDEFFFAVATTYSGDRAEQVATVDSASLGIKITMYDYGQGNEVTAGDKLDGMTAAVGGNDLYDPQGAQALVRRYLDPETGLPVTTNGSAMSGLFGSGTISNGKTVVSDVNHLFVKSYYDANGTFRYRSEDNYAYLDGTDFKVYRQVATPYTKEIAVGRPYYYHGHFMPFNDIDITNKLSRLLNQYGTGELDIGDGRSYEPVYGIQGTPDYYHGMKMEAEFVQPRDGKMENNEDMVFKFTGDDDMWVYIDGVLVLDIGGIHEPLSGSIDFATGTVKNPTGSSLAGTKTLYEIFMEAKNGAPQSVIDAINVIKWKDVNDDGTPDTFADYSAHTFSSFYMERGAGASNLDIQFNLKVVHKNEFVVKKETPPEIDTDYINQIYTFQATYSDGSPIIPGDLGNCIRVIYENRKDEYGDEVPVIIDENGCFTLKAGEAAVFKTRDETVPYNVREINIDSNLIEKVEVNGEEKDHDSGVVEAGSTPVMDRSKVVFTNYPELQNLLITKHLLFDTELLGESQPVFEFRVFMESEVETEDGPEQKLVAYAQRPYYLVREEGGVLYYYTLTGENNAPEKQGTSPVICSYTGGSGSINSIPPEYTVLLPDIVVGNNFYVEEYTVENTGMPDGYYFIRSEKEDCDDSDLLAGKELSAVLIRPSNDTNTPESGVSGKVIKDADAHVHVYNGKETQITVKKNWNKGDVGIPNDAYVLVTLGRYKMTDDPANVWTITFSHGGGSGSMASQTVVKGKQYKLPSCGFTAPEGKVFDRWNLGAPGQEITITGNTELIAQWKEKPVEYCTVSFSANGGTGSMQSVSVPKGSVYQLPRNEFTPPQYSVFTGWDQGNADDSITINEDTIIKAQWELTGFNVWVNVRNVPDGASMWMLFQDADNYSTVNGQNPTVGSGNSSYLFHADTEGNYQMAFGKNGNWGDTVITVVGGNLSTFDNHGSTGYNIKSLLNGATYTINCTTPGSGNDPITDDTITLTINDVQWLGNGWFETGAVDDIYLEMHVKCSNEIVQRVTLDKSNRWKATVMLPKKDQYENDYQYYLDFVYSSPLIGARAEYSSFGGKDHATKLILSYTMDNSSSERQENETRSLMDYFLPRAYAEDASVYLESAAPALPDPDDGKIWVKDRWTEFVTLRNSNGWIMEGITVNAADDEGNIYVYYIDEVQEYNMPNPSEWSVERDSNNLLVWGDHMTGGEHENGTLSLTNTIKGHITIEKEDVQDISTSPAASINTDNQFTFVVKQNGVQVGQDVTVTKDGQAVTIDNLELGTAYRYTVEESATNRDIPGYEFTDVTITVDGQPYDPETGFTLTNNTPVVVRAVNQYTRKHKYIPVHDEVSFRKVNADGTAQLEGATFTLYDGMPGADGTTVLGTYTGKEFTISTRDDIIRNLFGYTTPAAADPGTGTEGNAGEETDATEAAEHSDVTVYLKETIAPANRQLTERVYAITVYKDIIVGTEPDVTRDAFVTTITYTMTVTDGENTFSDSVDVPNPVETVDLAVDKKWFQNETLLEGDSYLPDAEITVKLQQSTDDGATWTEVEDSVTVLKRTDNWSTSWTGLPGFIETVTEGTAVLTEIRYRIVETAVKINDTEETVTLDSAKVVIPEDPDLTDEDETLHGTLVNYLPMTDRHAEKKWEDAENTLGLRDAITGLTFTLSAEANNVSINLETYGFDAAFISQTFTEESEGWPNVKADWNNLPKYTSDGYEIIYSITETMTVDDGQTDEYTTVISDLNIETNTWTVTNRLGTAAAELGGAKTMKGGETPQNIYTFELSAEEGVPMPAGLPSPATVNNSGGAFAFSSILYKRSDMEDATPVAEKEGSVEKTFIYKVLELTQLALEEGVAEPDIVFDPAVYTVTVRVERNTVTGEMTADNPVYSKTVGGETTTEGITGISFENEELTEVNIEKVWRRKMGEAPPEGTKVTLTLFKGMDDEAEALASVELDGAADTTTDQTAYEYEEWKAKWTKLPKYEDGKEITYVVMETPELEGYTVRYVDGKSWALTGETITNTLNETDLKIVKVNAEGMTQELTGAVFTLTRVDSETKEPIAGEDPTTIDMSDKSTETVQNLTDGTYMLQETQAPAGFIGMSAPVFITITDGAVREPDLSGTTTIRYTEKEGETPATVIVGNIPGAELPATGGSGTLAYTIGGLALILAAGVLMISRKKRRHN